MPTQPYREPAPIEPDPAPEPASEAARIGSLRSIHASPPLHRALLGPVLIAILIVALGAVFEAPLVVLLILAAVTLALLSWSPLRIRGWSAALHAEGVVLMRSGTRKVVAFADVNEVWFEVDPLHSRAGAYLRALRLVDYAGEEHRLHIAVNEGATLANSVLRGCSGPLLVEALKALREGETLTFGQIQLDRAGVTVKGARATWDEIRLVVVQHARLLFYRRLPILSWRSVRLDRIPNPTVFAGLVTHCVANMRIEDQLIAPLASKAEGLRAQTAGDSSGLALRNMLVGGLVCAAGVIVTLATYSANNHSYFLAYGPILFGAFRFFQGLAALLSGPRR